MKMVVKSKGKISDETAGPEIPDLLQIQDISYGKIVDYRRPVIELK
jgi:hypothetical protein